MILRERKTKNKINIKELAVNNEQSESSYKLSNESESSDNEIEGKKRHPPHQCGKEKLTLTAMQRNKVSGRSSKNAINTIH
jgi:hypothetical protein